MNKAFINLEFSKILDRLESICYTEIAKNQSKTLTPYLSETELSTHLRNTTEARTIIDQIGSPPLVSMNDMDKLLITAKQGGLLSPNQIEYLGSILTAIKRMMDFLNRCKRINVGIAYYNESLDPLEDLREEIMRSIRSGTVDDYASNELRDLRRNILNLETKIKDKAEGMLKNNKECYSDTFVVNRNGHICLPIKKEYKHKISGAVIDKSSTGSTLFIEPTAIGKLSEDLSLLKLDEENEVRKILYTLTAQIADHAYQFEENVNVIEKLDFIFAKSKLSSELDAIPPKINTSRFLNIKNGLNPLMDKDTCVPLNICIRDHRGIVITGPNTGGKTVAIKTVGLFSLMAQCGLHIPCEEGDICMNSQVLCDIGDGQNISENLSTFSAHITNILDILNKIDSDSLVILDELGSGTDPTEGMGIAIAILEELKRSKCTFLVTTHYPEVKIYADNEEEIINARMSFDRETLKPLYQLELGKAGESCALYIAKRLGMPDHVIVRAGKEAYGNNAAAELNFLRENGDDYKDHKEPNVSNNHTSSKLIKKSKSKKTSKRAETFQVGDCVIIYPDEKLGIVCRKSNHQGEILVQIQKKKILINHKRLKLHVPASQLYPEDYDFSIIFDSVANRKARHKMQKGYQPDLEIEIAKNNEYD